MYGSFAFIVSCLISDCAEVTYFPGISKASLWCSPTSNSVFSQRGVRAFMKHIWPLLFLVD